MNDNVLIIGNGFDLYHRLPTRYTDFLKFKEYWHVFNKLYKKQGSTTNLFDVRLTENGELLCETMEDFAEKGTYEQEKIDYLNVNLEKNIWINYFLKYPISEYGWVDFENEIKNALVAFDRFIFGTLKKREADRPPLHSGNRKTYSKLLMFIDDNTRILEKLATSVCSRSKLTEEVFNDAWANLIKKMSEELENLERCLELYLELFVSRIKMDTYSNQIANLNYKYVLNFNYTDTHIKNPNYKDNKIVHYVHGQIKKKNIILGIGKDEINDKKCVEFEKWYQRINNNTGETYNEWIPKQLTALEDTPIKVYIMGHSLAINDKEILGDFFESDLVCEITIFYREGDKPNDLIKNLNILYGTDFIIDNKKSGRIKFQELEKAVKFD